MRVPYSMPMDVLVTGSTGTQGGSVARSLLRKDGFTVHGLTRDASSDDASALEQAGATMVEGDLSNKDRLVEILEDVDAVFGVTDFWEHGYEDEVDHGTNLVDAAQEAGIEHFVFSSVGGAERDTGIPHFESKREIEEHLEAAGLPATVLRPVFFMQNFEGMREMIVGGELTMGLEQGRGLQMVDIEDYGALVAEAFDDRDRYLDASLEVASDEVTLQGAAIRFADILGSEVRVNALSLDEVEESQGEESAVMFRWFNEEGYEGDIAKLRAEHDVSWSRLETYLEREGWSKAGT